MMKTCSTHGSYQKPGDINDAEVIQLENEEDFTKFVCFLATLQFKLFKITPSSNILDFDKQQTSNFTLNIIFQFLQYNQTDYLWYPLRACAEYLLDDDQDNGPSHRLNADNLLMYKLTKDLKTNLF